MLLGVNHTVNTSIHYAEKLAGRHQFVRWALSRERVVECRGFPGCSNGFEALRLQLAPYTRRVEVGEAFVEALPLKELFREVETSLRRDPLALLCQRMDCERCNSIRDIVEGVG